MNENDRIRWAIVFGFCNLLSIVVLLSVTQVWTTVPVASFALLLFFGSFALHLVGYICIGHKYESAPMRRAAVWLIGATVLMLALTIPKLYFLSLREEPTIVNAAVVAGFILYSIAPIFVGISSLHLGKYLGVAASAPLFAGVLGLEYTLYDVVHSVLGSAPPLLLGNFVWAPAPEALFVSGSLLLFFRAMQAGRGGALA